MNTRSLLPLLGILVALTPLSARADDFRDMVAQFGRPDFVDSTERDIPRPFIVVKWAKYNRANVKAVFVPDAPGGSPPPYAGWSLVGYTDMASDTKISPDEAHKRLRSARKK